MLPNRENLIPLCVALIIAFGIAASGSASEDRGSSAERKRAAQQQKKPTECPPDNSSIAVFTRLAFDQGHVGPSRHYQRFLGELADIERSNYADEDILKKSIAATTAFVERMKLSGQDIDVADVIIHREAELNFMVRTKNPISKARYALELAVIREMKRVICGR